MASHCNKSFSDDIDRAWQKPNCFGDPKWLLPMLCRKGNVARQDIGAIRIFEHETKVEVAEPIAAQFAVNMRRPGGDNIRVERLNYSPERVTFTAPARDSKPKRPSKAERKRRAKP